MKIFVSKDGTTYTLVKTYTSNDNSDFNQKFINDLTKYVKGASTVYVKMDWLVFDSPHIFGIKAVTIVGNSNGIDKTPATTTITATAPAAAVTTTTAESVTSETSAESVDNAYGDLTSSETTTSTTTQTPVRAGTSNGVSAGIVILIVLVNDVVIGGGAAAAYYLIKMKKKV